MVSKKFEPLFETVEIKEGVTAPNRLALPPMLVFASNDDDTVGEEDLAYFNLRNDTGGIIISSAATVDEKGHGMPNQLTVYSDDNISGLKKLTSVMKEKGNLAIIQLHHAGRESLGTVQKFGHAYGPSEMDFEWLDYDVKGLSEKEVEETIDSFGEATRRAIEAGFDGVEVHGANHYLLQQFFSEFSNQRTDKWGGSFEKRMAFPLAVLKRVLEVAGQHADDNFIVGYRISPEEIHGDVVGYTLEDSLKLIEKVIETGAEYIHISSMDNDYSKPPASGGEKSITEIIYNTVDGRIPVITAGGVLTPEQALDALQYTDIVAIGRANLIDPDFVPKLRDGKEDEINYAIQDNLEELAFPQKLGEFWQAENSPLGPLKGLSE